MSSTFKKFTDTDKVSTRTLLHEAIPITASIVSGSYVASGAPTNCKSYAHGMFQSVYDYPYLSSSANHIFDISVGISPSSALSSSTTAITQQSKKINMYNQMAQVLMGYDATGSILRFDADGNLGTGADKMNEVFFINFSRLLVKDEVAKGTFQLELDVESTLNTSGQPFTNSRIRLNDLSASAGFHVNSPAGEYGILYANTTTSTALVDGETLADATTYAPCGLIYYQAGVAVLSGSIFEDAATGGILKATPGSSVLRNGIVAGSDAAITGSTIDEIADGLRHRIYNIQFNNTIELNSTVYFCRANHNEFNYSANPTYLTGSRIRVKKQASDNPISYITSVGLYSADGALLGVAKLSEPIKKRPSEEYIFRCRVDY